MWLFQAIAWTCISNAIYRGLFCFAFNDFRWEVVVIVDIGRIGDRHYLNFLFIYSKCISFCLFLYTEWTDTSQSQTYQHALKLIKNADYKLLWVKITTNPHPSYVSVTVSHRVIFIFVSNFSFHSSCTVTV